jgi:hypothetical protein
MLARVLNVGMSGHDRQDEDHSKSPLEISASSKERLAYMDAR